MKHDLNDQAPATQLAAALNTDPLDGAGRLPDSGAVEMRHVPLAFARVLCRMLRRVARKRAQEARRG